MIGLGGGLRLPWRQLAVVGGVSMLGGLALLVSYPADRVIGAMFEADQQLDEAAFYYSRWSRAHPLDFDARWHAAELLLQTAHPDEAVEALEAMHRDFPDDARILERLVAIEDSLLRVPEVVPRLEALARIRPDDPDIVRRLADHHRWFGNREALVARLSQLVRMGDYAEERTELVELLLSQRRYDDLIALLSSDVDNMPNPVSVRLALFEAYLRQGRRDQAMVQLAHIVKISPERADVRRRLAEMLISTGRLESAISLYSEATLLTPDQRSSEIDDLYESAAERSLALGQRKQAEELLRQRIDNNPTDVSARLAFAALHGERENEIAVEQMGLLLEADPKSIEARLALAERLSWLGKTEAAIRELRAVVAQRPSSRRIRRDLARHLVWIDRTDEAIAQMRVLASDSEDDHRWLIRTLIDSDRLAEAVTQARALCVRSNSLANLRLLLDAAIEAQDCTVTMADLGPLAAQLPAAGEAFINSCATRVEVSP